MPRTARRKSKTGIYHIIAQGINRQQIFHDDYDRKKFLAILKECKDLGGFELYAYCLMENHVHFLIKTVQEDVALFFKRIGVRYAGWYNWKHERVGHLFQDRFKSEVVEDDAYFLTALRYIHQNPVKAGFCDNIDDYPWSSYSDYIGDSNIVDTGYAINMIGLGELIRFHSLENVDEGLEAFTRIRMTDGEVTLLIEDLCGCRKIRDFQKLELTTRFSYIKNLKKAGASIRQISRVTGSSKAFVEKGLYRIKEKTEEPSPCL